MIKVKVLAWIEDKDQLFVVRNRDKVKGDDYYRPIGGSVNFGETTVAALHREVLEELVTRISITGEPLVLENIFTCDGAKGHEIDFLYPARINSSKFYQRKSFPLVEETGEVFESSWINIVACLTGELRLVPEGLLDWYRKKKTSI